VLDEKEDSGRCAVSDVGGVDNVFLGTNIRPRTIGFTAIYRFGAG
jgi:hypothetical protein